MAGYKVVADAVRAQATKWDDLAARTQPAYDYANSATLGVTAFLLMDPTGLSQVLTFDNPINATMHQFAYSDIQTTMATLLGQAVTEFTEIGDALIKVAAKYEEAEEIIELDLNEIYMA